MSYYINFYKRCNRYFYKYSTTICLEKLLTSIRFHIYGYMVGDWNLPDNIFFMNIYTPFFKVENISFFPYITRTPNLYLFYVKYNLLYSDYKDFFSQPIYKLVFPIDINICINKQNLLNIGFRVTDTSYIQFCNNVDYESFPVYYSTDLYYSNIISIDSYIKYNYNFFISKKNFPSNMTIPYGIFKNIYSYRNFNNMAINLSTIKIWVNIKYITNSRIIYFNFTDEDIRKYWKTLKIKTSYNYKENKIEIDHINGIDGIIFPYSGSIEYNAWYYISNQYYWDKINLKIQSDIIGPKSNVLKCMFQPDENIQIKENFNNIIVNNII